MSLFRLINLALHGLKINKLRTILTTTGLIIGIATVIIALSVGESAKAAIVKQLMAFGGNTIIAEISVPNTSHANSGSEFVMGVQITSLKESDLKDALKLPNVESGYGMIMSKEKMVYMDKSRKTMFMGTNYTYPNVDEIKLAKGRFFSFSEEKRVARVVVLGPKLAEELFGDIDPIGKNIKIKQISFQVVGVLEPKGMTFFMDMDDMAFIPLQTAQKLLLGIDYITNFMVKVSDNKFADQTAFDMRSLLRKNHHIPPDDEKKDDFQVTTMSDALGMMDSIIGGVTLLLTAIAVISLIVGGVGIMNIMYVSVSERTHEIGLRKAIGAQGHNIMMQFLFEALGVTLAGGIIGIVLGLTITFLAATAANLAGLDWKMVISFQAVLMAFFASSAVGLVFGIYPARKAASLDPIIALRKE